MSRRNLTSIKITPTVRNRIRNLKRGGESYNELLMKMAEQYNPESGQDGETTKTGA